MRKPPEMNSETSPRGVHSPRRYEYTQSDTLVEIDGEWPAASRALGEAATRHVIFAVKWFRRRPTGLPPRNVAFRGSGSLCRAFGSAQGLGQPR